VGYENYIQSDGIFAACSILFTAQDYLAIPKLFGLSDGDMSIPNQQASFNGTISGTIALTAGHASVVHLSYMIYAIIHAYFINISRNGNSSCGVDLYRILRVGADQYQPWNLNMSSHSHAPLIIFPRPMSTLYVVRALRINHRLRMLSFTACYTTVLDLR
jgi:hypothetical protein